MFAFVGRRKTRGLRTVVGIVHTRTRRPQVGAFPNQHCKGCANINMLSQDIFLLFLRSPGFDFYLSHGFSMWCGIRLWDWDEKYILIPTSHWDHWIPHVSVTALPPFCSFSLQNKEKQTYFPKLKIQVFTYYSFICSHHPFTSHLGSIWQDQATCLEAYFFWDPRTYPSH